MSKLKTFYTKEELSKLSELDILDLMSFVGGDTTYYYSEIDKISKDGEEHCIKFKSGEEIYTKSKDIIDKILFGKSRYELIFRSINQIDLEKKERDELYSRIEESVKSRVNPLIQQIETNRDDFRSFVGDLRDDYKLLTNTIYNKTEEALNKVEAKNDELKALDLDKYENLMRKIDKISKAFETLIDD